MNGSDEELKQLILSQRVPPLSHDFVERTWQRVQPELAVQLQPQAAWAGSGRARQQPRSHQGTRLVTLLLGLVVAAWAAQHLWQAPTDEDLNRLDPVGMSSLLTL